MDTKRVVWCDALQGGLTIFWQVGVVMIAAVMGVLLVKVGGASKEEGGIGKAV